ENKTILNNKNIPLLQIKNLKVYFYLEEGILKALLKQDMELAGSILMILSFLTVIGTFISDILLILLDPRIRYEKSVV
ncbi:unnamed protein product, partial [marine sediment metagenome]